MDNRKEQLNYTLILHQIRKQLGLSLMEYCIADSIYHLSNNPNNKIQGWCYAPKENIADFLGTTRQTIFDNLNKLIKKGLIERDEDTKYLRTTLKWYEKVILVRMNREYKETLHIVKKLDDETSRNLTPNSKETLPNIYTNSNTNNKKEKEFNFKDILEEMFKDPKRHIRIIAQYWKFKGIMPENRDQYQTLLKREVRAARDLNGFSDEQIMAVMEYLETNETFKWNLTSVGKYIGEDLRRIKPIKNS
jgi:hypothetical protein